jgi:hypothetical protein
LRTNSLRYSGGDGLEEFLVPGGRRDHNDSIVARLLRERKILGLPKRRAHPGNAGAGLPGGEFQEQSGSKGMSIEWKGRKSNG